ncbi:MAG: cytochrome c, partial [Gammaproteobacteria bacterium]|nr:cytochrome c [Gammaproteobacteria bacterium]
MTASRLLNPTFLSLGVVLVSSLLAQPVAGADATAAHAAEMRSGSAVDGKQVYESVCAACHKQDGTGLPGAFPPVADSDYLKADHERSIAAVVHGLTGKIKVNGQAYNGAMPPMGYLGDAEIAAALTYVLESWNGGGTVTAAQVAAVRGEGIAAKAKHPVTSDAEHAYRGTPSPIAPDSVVSMMESDGPPMTVAEFDQAKQLFFERCAGCHGVLRKGA